MINNVTLVGRLTNDVELRYTQSGNAVGSFTLAVQRAFKSANGERESDFIRCQIWRKSAENLANFTHKGSSIGVVGRIQTGSYEKDGQKVYTTDVIVENFSLLESKGNGQSQNTQSQNTQSNFSQQNANNSFSNVGQEIDISDDDLPF